MCSTVLSALAWFTLSIEPSVWKKLEKNETCFSAGNTVDNSTRSSSNVLNSSSRHLPLAGQVFRVEASRIVQLAGWCSILGFEVSRLRFLGLQGSLTTAEAVSRQLQYFAIGGHQSILASFGQPEAF